MMLSLLHSLSVIDASVEMALFHSSHHHTVMSAGIDGALRYVYGHARCMEDKADNQRYGLMTMHCMYVSMPCKCAFSAQKSMKRRDT